MEVIKVTFLINNHMYQGYTPLESLDAVKSVDCLKPLDILVIDGLEGITNRVHGLDLSHVKNTYVCGWKRVEISI